MMKRSTVGWALPTVFLRSGGQRSPYNWRQLLTLVAVVAIVAMMAGNAVACPMCKAALASQDRAHGDLVGGFFWSILFMLSMPFVIFGSLTTYMYVLVRRARREREATLSAQGFVDGPLEVGDARSREPATVDHA
jgi:uncharacterized membrane protein